MKNIWKIGEITIEHREHSEDGNKCLETLENAGFLLVYDRSDTEIVKASICVEK